MTKLKRPHEYKFLYFEKSKSKNKKYNAVFRHIPSSEIKKVSFGDSRYEHYKDITGLDIWSHKNHLDKKRRSNFRARHKKNAQNIFSSAYFSYHYLW